MGKTMLMKRFRQEHPPSFNPMTGTLKTPVLAMEMTSRPGERRFYAELLVASPFLKYRQAALHRERLLDAEAERGKGTWASPADIARLLLMRRVPKPLPDEGEFWRFRVLGAIIPELDGLVAAKPVSLPTSGTPILPLCLRPALLAGVAIVDRAGPGMLPMLQSHTIGDNRARFGETAERVIAHARKPWPFLQWQLI